MLQLLALRTVRYCTIAIILLGAFQNCKKAPDAIVLKPDLPDFEALTTVLLDSNGKEIFQYWEFDNEQLWWQHDLGSIEAIQSYRDTLKNHLGLSFSVEREHERYQATEVTKVETYKDKDRDKINLDLIQYGLMGTIRDMNFLEAQLLNHQLKQYPLFSHPTEFHAFIALHKDLQLVRVYFAASDQGFPPQPRIIISELEREASNGWTLEAHLHNHYGTKEKGYFGKMAPSLADAQYFKMLKERFDIKEALITNGFTTVSIPAQNFEKFESH